MIQTSKLGFNKSIENGNQIKKKNGIYAALIPNYPTNTNPNDI